MRFLVSVISRIRIRDLNLKENRQKEIITRIHEGYGNQGKRRTLTIGPRISPESLPATSIFLPNASN